MNAVLVVRYEISSNIFSELIFEISKKFKVYVYDNSKVGLNLGGSAIYYFHDPDNGGLAKAINHCVNQAISDGVEQLVYFDQDSRLNLELISDLFSSYDRVLKKHPNLFVLGPQPVMVDGDFYPIKLEKEIDNDLFGASEIITSGMVFKPFFVRELGYFDEDLFLDLVDFEICWRARAAGMLVAVDRRIKMVHEVGEATIKIPFRVLPVSSPVRNYYQLRNMLYLAIYKYNYSKSKVFYYLLRRAFNIFINLIFSDNKLLRLKYNYCGVKDAIKNKMGKAPF